MRTLLRFGTNFIRHLKALHARARCLREETISTALQGGLDRQELRGLRMRPWRRRGIVAVLAVAWLLPMLPPDLPADAHYPPDHITSDFGEQKSRSYVTDASEPEFKVRFHQFAGCGFSPLKVEFNLLLSPTTPGKTVTLKFLFGDGEFVEGEATEETPFSKSFSHDYKTTSSLQKNFYPQLLVDGVVLNDNNGRWEAVEAPADAKGPWPIWSIPKRAGVLYIGNDEEWKPPVTLKEIGGDGANANEDGTVTFNSIGGSAGAKVSVQGQSIEVEKDYDSIAVAKVGHLVTVNKGCSLSTSDVVKVTFRHQIDASAVAQVYFIGSAKVNFRATIVSGADQTQPLSKEVSAVPIVVYPTYDDARWFGFRQDQLNSTFSDGEVGKRVYVEYAFTAKGSGMSLESFSGGKNMHNWGLEDPNSRAWVHDEMGLRSVYFDWTNDVHQWQV